MQITPSTCVGKGDKDKRALMGHEAFNSSAEEFTPRSGGFMRMPEYHAVSKRDTLTLGPLVTVPDRFLNCPGEGGGKNFCVLCSMLGEDSSDSDNSKREVPSLFRREEDDSCPYYPPGDGGKCYDSDSTLFERADPQETKVMTLSFVNNNAAFGYLKYPPCNAKNDGPSGVAKWYLPEFMLSSSKNINDNRRCLAKTTKENTVQSANNKYLVDNNAKLPASDFLSEHIFEVHLISHFLEWVCNGRAELTYGPSAKIDFPEDWKRPDSAWCLDVFGGPNGGMTWSRNNGPNKHWVQHTADFLGSGANLDLLVLYHKMSNGVKQVITEGKKSGLPANAKGVADRVMMSATVFDYLRELSDKWTKPIQNVELISDEFDAQYTRQYVNTKPAGKALEMPKAPRDVKHWGLRTLWAYWIDRHLDKVEQVQADWHKTAKGKMEGLGAKDANAKKFAAQTMMTGDAAVGNFKFPQKNPDKPLPGTATSSSNDQSKYGMWGDNQLGKLGL